MRAIFSLSVLIASLYVDVTKAKCETCADLCETVDGPNTVPDYAIETDKVVCKCKLGDTEIDPEDFGYGECSVQFEELFLDANDRLMAQFCCSSCKNSDMCTEGGAPTDAVAVGSPTDAVAVGDNCTPQSQYARCGGTSEDAWNGDTCCADELNCECSTERWCQCNAPDQFVDDSSVVDCSFFESGKMKDCTQDNGCMARSGACVNFEACTNSNDCGSTADPECSFDCMEGKCMEKCASSPGSCKDWCTDSCENIGAVRNDCGGCAENGGCWPGAQNWPSHSGASCKTAAECPAGEQCHCSQNAGQEGGARQGVRRRLLFAREKTCFCGV